MECNSSAYSENRECVLFVPNALSIKRMPASTLSTDKIKMSTFISSQLFWLVSPDCNLKWIPSMLTRKVYVLFSIVLGETREWAMGCRHSIWNWIWKLGRYPQLPFPESVQPKLNGSWNWRPESLNNAIPLLEYVFLYFFICSQSQIILDMWIWKYTKPPQWRLDFFKWNHRGS